MRNDKRGDGHFGAERGTRKHNGVDIVVEPGQTVRSPVDGTVRRTNVRPYGDDNRYSGIEIETPDGHRFKMFYMSPTIENGTKVKAGQPVGVAQDISIKHPINSIGAMTPHLHIEARDKDGNLVDPTSAIFDEEN